MPAPPPQYLRYWLVVHGSYAPGGDDHFRLSDLRGEWHRGSIPATPGPTFSDMIVSRSHEATDAWAFELAPQPDLPWDASIADGNTGPVMYERWESLDAVFGDSVARLATEFTFAESNSFALEDDGPRVVQANTYGSLRVINNGRYDSPHPAADLVELWLQVVAGDKDYDPSTFLGMVNDLSPDRYEEAFGGLPNSAGFISRLRRLVAGQTPPQHGEGTWSLYFNPQEHNAVDDATLVALAKAQIEAMAAVVEQSIEADEWVVHRDELRALNYRIAQTGDDIDLGALHYWLRDHFGDSDFAERDSWTYCLGEATYSIAASYELASWLNQDWSAVTVDLEPLYALWRAGGRTKIGEDGICHVVSTWKG